MERLADLLLCRYHSVMEILGVILAGGAARRMGGGDKVRLDLGGRSVVEELLSRLRPQCADVVLNANGDAARFADLGLAVVPDPVPDLPGPLAGILAGLDAAAARGMDHALTVAGDTPFIPHDMAARLAAGDAPAVMAASNGRLHPVCGLWHVSLRDNLRAALLRGEARVRRFAEEQGAVTVAFAADGHDPFLNINTPEDLALARALAQAAASIRTGAPL